jgi:hypothetical protein
MEFFKKLFGGGGADRDGMYFYIKPHGCPDIVRVRIDVSHDKNPIYDNEDNLSDMDPSIAYFVRKTVRADNYRCNRSAELELFFDANRQLKHTELMGGVLVSKEEYDAWVAAQETAT